MKLKAEKRELVGKKVKQLRAKDLIPSSIYGPSTEPVNIQVDSKSFRKVFDQVGYSNFFDLELEDGKPIKVLVKEVYTHPIKDTFITVNFYQIDETKKLTVEVPVEVTGTSPAVQLNLGFLVQQLDNITVYCLPKDLPHSVTVDLEVLADVGDAISVGDIKLPENVELASSMDATTAIAYIGTAQKEEEAEVVAEATEETETTEETKEPATEE